MLLLEDALNVEVERIMEVTPVAVQIPDQVLMQIVEEIMLEAAHGNNRRNPDGVRKTSRLLRLITIAFSVLIAGLFLNGAEVLSGWYAAPAELSKFVVTVATMLGIARCFDWIFRLLMKC